MMRWQRTIGQLGLTLTPAQEWACTYLELAHGMIFCVDFGWSNAESIADSLFSAACRQKCEWLQ